MSATAFRARVLVIDDEPAFAYVVSRILDEHDVTLVDNAAAAFALLATGGPWDVVLCDLHLPGMTGIDLYDRMLAEGRPEVNRVLFVTGGAWTERARAFVARMGPRVIEKPFDADALRERVRRMAAEAPRSRTGEHRVAPGRAAAS